MIPAKFSLHGMEFGTFQWLGADLGGDGMEPR